MIDLDQLANTVEISRRPPMKLFVVGNRVV